MKTLRERLEQCFTSLEWEYLTCLGEFQIELKKGCKTLDDFERLATLGDKLLTHRQLMNPDAPPLSRPRIGKHK